MSGGSKLFEDIKKNLRALDPCPEHKSGVSNLFFDSHSSPFHTFFTTPFIHFPEVSMTDLSLYILPNPPSLPFPPYTRLFTSIVARALIFSPLR